MGRHPLPKVAQHRTPLAERLVELFTGHAKQRRVRGGVHARADIVGEKLCDDVIKYLAPTLEPYKGCTIVDINPGACLWSEKLHDFLRPKRHILMEPDEAYVGPFVEPLVHRPGSTYVHTRLSGINSLDYQSNVEEVFRDGKFLGRTRLADDDPKLRRIDTSLLVTGSLLRRKNLSSSLRGVVGSQLGLQHAAWSSLSNRLFHQTGLVRMLWWIAEQDKISMFPFVANYKAYGSASNGLACNINQVAAVQNVHTYTKEARAPLFIRSRYSGISAASADQVRSRMADRGMVLPDGRDAHAVDDCPDDGKHTWGSPLAVRYDTVADFESEFARVASRTENLLDNITKTGGERLAKRQWSVLKEQVDQIQYKQVHEGLIESPSRALIMGKRIHQSQPVRNENLPVSQLAMVIAADLCLSIINLEVHYKVLEDKGLDVSGYKQKLASLHEKIKRAAEPKTLKSDVERLWEDILDLAVSPSILLSDRRQYEPLQAQASDAEPATNVALLDMTPHERDMAVPGLASRDEVARWCQYLVKFIFGWKNRSLPSVLDRLAPNAAQDLIPMVPAITDPRKGGRLDPNNLKVRQMTDEMYEGLAKAWVEWPFRPPMHELNLELFDDGSAGSSVKAPVATTPEAVTESEED